MEIATERSSLSLSSETKGFSSTTFDINNDISAWDTLDVKEESFMNNLSRLDRDPDMHVNMTVEYYLEELNREFAHRMMPAVVVLAVLMVLGCVGNTIVLFVYSCRTKRGTVTRFIQSLAVFDLLSCCVAIPGEIIDIINNYTFGSHLLCKVVRNINLFCTLSSGAILVVVAIDRYRRICCPLQRQISPRGAAVVISCCVVASLLISLPAAAFNGSRTVVTDISSVNGTDCSVSDSFVKTVFPAAYNSLQMFLFLVGALILIVLYSLIGNKVCRHTHRQELRRKSFRLSRSRFSAASPSMGSSYSTNMDKDCHVDADSSSPVNKYDFTELAAKFKTMNQKQELFSSGAHISADVIKPDLLLCSSNIHQENSSEISESGEERGSIKYGLQPTDSKCLQPIPEEYLNISLSNSHKDQTKLDSLDITEAQDVKETIEADNVFNNTAIKITHECLSCLEKADNQTGKESSACRKSAQFLQDETLITFTSVCACRQQSEKNLETHTQFVSTEAVAGCCKGCPHLQYPPFQTGKDCQAQLNILQLKNVATVGDKSVTMTLPAMIEDKINQTNVSSLSSLELTIIDKDQQDGKTTNKNINNNDNNNASVNSVLRQKANTVTISDSFRLKHENLPLGYYKEGRQTLFNQVDDGSHGNEGESITFKKLKRKESVSRKAGTRRATLMLFLITVVYVLSFLPHLVLMAVKALDERSLTGLGPAWELAQNLLIRSYFINSMANPIIYSFFSNNFCRECIHLAICKK